MDKSVRKALMYLVGGFVVLAVIFGFVFYFAIIQPMNAYVSEKAFPLEHIPISKEEEKAVQEKLIKFVGSEKIDSLILNTVEVNHLIRTNERIQAYNVPYVIRLEDSLFNVRCTAPVGVIQNHLSKVVRLLNVKGFINAEYEGYIRKRKGKLMIVSTRAQMNGQPAHFTLLGKRTHLDMGDFFHGEAMYERFVKRTAEIYIRKGKLVILKKGEKPDAIDD